MKRKIALILGILGITVNALAFTGTTSNTDNSICPLKGTPACPGYPSGCK